MPVIMCQFICGPTTFFSRGNEIISIVGEHDILIDVSGNFDICTMAANPLEHNYRIQMGMNKVGFLIAS